MVASPGGGLRAGDAGLEACDDGEPVGVARGSVGDAGSELFDVAEGNPELRVEYEFEAVKAGRRDSDDGEVMAGENNGLADDGGVGGEAALPEAMAENDDRKLFLAGQKAAAERHRNPRDAEEIGRGRLTPHALGITIASY